jgi:hypothetical protein
VSPDDLCSKRDPEASGFLLETLRPRRVRLHDRIRARPADAVMLGLRAAHPREERETVEQCLLRGVVVGRVLRVPLHADHPPIQVDFQVVVAFDRLHEAVGGPAGHQQSAPDAVHPLVMMRGRREGGDLGGREQAAGVLDLHVVQRLRVEDGDAVLEHPGQVRQVGVERAAERDVHDLHPATDAEGRQPHPVGRQEQLDLELVAIVLDPVEAAVAGIAAVSGRIDVAAAHEEEPIEGFEELLERAVLAGGDDRRPGSGAAEAFDVRAGDAVSAVGPAGDTIVSEVVRDDRDERAVGHDRCRVTSTNRRNVSRPRRS